MLTAKFDERQALIRRYNAVRTLSEALTVSLSSEDQSAQSMPDASPTKWHLAHTSWFFETVVLTTHIKATYQPFDERFFFLFNSYYESLGPRHPRAERGLLTRPALAQVLEYRAYVDAAMNRFITDADETIWAPAAPLIELGLHHEQQHQELILTDIKHLLSRNLLRPAYLEDVPPRHRAATPALRWIECPGGRVAIGHDAQGFAFDNETPRHATLLRSYQLANRLITCGEYFEFMADGGYQRPEFWLSDGWATVQAQNWQAPLYWHTAGGNDWRIFTLNGMKALDPAEPVCHVSFYEAAAYAAWADARLPTEFEWEAATADLPIKGHLLDADYPHPRPAEPAEGFTQLYGDAWEWTRSSYDPYPGFKPLQGTVAEYNGKFMIGQMVLRGGSCATPTDHIRASYRNFFPPGARWQFSGIRLARDL